MKFLLQGLKNLFGVGIYLLLIGLLLEVLTIVIWQSVVFPFSLSQDVRIFLTFLSVLCCLSGIIWFNKTLNLVKIHLKGGDHQLITHGPFNYVRHPLYATLLITIPPLFIIWSADFLFIVPWAMIFSIAYCLVVVEERGMVRVFGDDYIRYKEYVPALLPYRGAGGERYRKHQS
jgi:protein-S-isoprenylcysteine O-methyltransferase Ste14